MWWSTIRIIFGSRGYGCETLSVAGLQPADGKEAPYRLGASAQSWVLSGLRPWDTVAWLIKSILQSDVSFFIQRKKMAGEEWDIIL